MGSQQSNIFIFTIYHPIVVTDRNLPTGSALHCYTATTKKLEDCEIFANSDGSCAKHIFAEGAQQFDETHPCDCGKCSGVRGWCDDKLKRHIVYVLFPRLAGWTNWLSNRFGFPYTSVECRAAMFYFGLRCRAVCLLAVVLDIASMQGNVFTYNTILGFLDFA